MNAIAQASAAPVTGPKLDNRRVLAGIVDLLIVGVGAAVILFAGDALSGDRGDVQGALAAVILGWALYYHFALESGGGQTVGKKLMNLRVVRADGSPAGMREVAVRTVLRVIDGAGAYIVGLIVMLATGQRRQRLGDLAAGTIVIDASAPSFLPAVATPVAEVTEPTVAPEAEADDYAPESDDYAPESDDYAPESDAYAPESDDYAPESDAYAPESEDHAPETDEYAPEAADAAPEAHDAAPEAEHFARETEDYAPERDDYAPDAEPEPAVADPSGTITLPPRPAPPATLADLAEESVAVADPVTDEQSAVTEEAAVAEPVDAEVEAEPEEALPAITSPSLEELARDVAAAQAGPDAHAEPVVDAEAELVADEPVEEPVEDGPVTVKSVETVSAIDLVMGAAVEDSDVAEGDGDAASQ